MALTRSDREQIADILYRRSGEIAEFKRRYTADSNHFGSVELALTREIERLRRLSDLIEPKKKEGE